MSMAASAVPTTTKPATLAAGGVNTCAITLAGAVRCWGYADDGQTITPADLGAAVAVTAGDAHICAITAAAMVRCWGASDFDQLSVPSDLGAVNSIDAGNAHTCAITSAGFVRCWGLNDVGQTDVPNDLGRVDSISVGGANSCAVKTGTLICWGDNSEGQLTIPSLSAAVTQVSVGGLHICAILATQAVVCWGNNEDGQTSVPANLSASFIATGAAHTCAITVTGSVSCWGNNWYGQGVVPGNLGIVQTLVVGAAHNCGATATGVMQCWGYNDDGEAAVNAPDAPVSVTAVAGDASVTVSWHAPDFDGGSAVASYLATASAGGSCTTTTLSCTIASLKNGQATTVAVQAINSAGRSQGATSLSVTPVVKLLPPAAPTSVVALPRAAGATIAWAAPPTSSGVKISSYLVTAQPGGSTCSAKASPCVFTNLTNGVQYGFSVVAVTNVGNSATSTAVFATVNPFVVMVNPQTVLAQGHTTVTVSGAPGGALITFLGAATGNAVAGGDGTARIDLTVSKGGVITAATTVAKIAYKATANVWVPTVKVPATATAGKAVAIVVTAARPGCVVSVMMSTGETYQGTTNASGALTFSPVVAIKGTVTATVTVDSVKFSQSAVLVK